jgi:hypothetical protein
VCNVRAPVTPTYHWALTDENMLLKERRSSKSVLWPGDGVCHVKCTIYCNGRLYPEDFTGWLSFRSLSIIRFLKIRS